MWFVFLTVKPVFNSTQEVQENFGLDLIIVDARRSFRGTRILNKSHSTLISRQMSRKVKVIGKLD